MKLFRRNKKQEEANTITIKISASDLAELLNKSFGNVEECVLQEATNKQKVCHGCAKKIHPNTKGNRCRKCCIKEALELRKQGMSNNEIAKHMGLSVVTVGSYLSKRSIIAAGIEYIPTVTLQTKIIDLLKHAIDPLTPKSIANLLDANPMSVGSALYEMYHSGLVYKPKPGFYSLVESSDE